jgi:hypothetical protein
MAAFIFFLTAAVQQGAFYVESESAVPQLQHASHLPVHLCNLSMLESDHAFCQPERIWVERKKIARQQNKNNVGSLDGQARFFWQRNWEPELHCDLMERVGMLGDGGKVGCALCPPWGTCHNNRPPCRAVDLRPQQAAQPSITLQSRRWHTVPCLLVWISQ